MATGHSPILKVTIAITIAGLLALLFPIVILPLLPPLRPVAYQLLVRLRDVFAFLAFTTAIAVGIFSTQRRDTHINKKKPFLEHHPLGSIFGEPGYGEVEHFYTDDGKPLFSPVTKKIDMNNDGDHVADHPRARASSGIQKTSIRPAMEAAHTQALPVSKEENGYFDEPKVHRKLHRKSSSLDDSVNYVPESDGASASTPDNTPSASDKQGSFASNKPSSKCNVHGETGEPAQEVNDMSAMSPGDLTRQADAFIAKFKEQMRWQRLESFQRYRRRIA